MWIHTGRLSPGDAQTGERDFVSIQNCSSAEHTPRAVIYFHRTLESLFRENGGTGLGASTEDILRPVFEENENPDLAFSLA